MRAPQGGGNGNLVRGRSMRAEGKSGWIKGLFSEEMMFALRIHNMWAKPCGGHGVCVNDP